MAKALFFFRTSHHLPPVSMATSVGGYGSGDKEESISMPFFSFSLPNPWTMESWGGLLKPISSHLRVLCSQADALWLKALRLQGIAPNKLDGEEQDTGHRWSELRYCIVLLELADQKENEESCTRANSIAPCLVFLLYCIVYFSCLNIQNIQYYYLLPRSILT